MDVTNIFEKFGAYSMSLEANPSVHAQYMNSVTRELVHPVY
jgi:hypothetical protein